MINDRREQSVIPYDSSNEVLSRSASFTIRKLSTPGINEKETVFSGDGIGSQLGEYSLRFPLLKAEEPSKFRSSIFLSGLFFSDLDTDGKFGPLTEETLYDFQKLNSLEADGKAGPETWKKIAELPGKEILRRGFKGCGVAALQAALNAISESETKLCH